MNHSHLSRGARVGAVALVACGALASTGCIGTRTNNPIPVRAAVKVDTKEARKRPAIDDKKVAEFGFQTYWDSYIRDEVLTSVTMEGDQLYAFTRSKRLYQIDLHSGMVNWMYEVKRELAFGETGSPIAEWVYKKRKSGLKRYDEIFFVAGDHLYSLDKKSGSEFFVVPLPFTASAPPSAGATHVYVGGWDDRIYAYSKEKPAIPDWNWVTQGDVLTRSVYHSPQVFVSSTDGNLYSFNAVTGEKRSTFRTEKRLLENPLLFNTLLYLPAEDYNLYVLGVTDGLIHYRYGAGAPINTSPVAIGNTIYFGAKGEGMHALLRKGFPKASEGNPNKTQHQLLWKRKGAKQVLCKGIKDVYLREKGKGRAESLVTKIDATKGTFRGSLSLTGVDFFSTNHFDPKDVVFRSKALRGGIIVLGFRNGWVIALKEKATIPGS